MELFSLSHFICIMNRHMLLVVLFLLNTFCVSGFLFEERTHRTDYCGSHRIRFHFPGCIPEFVVTEGCKGVCRSYAMPG